jgi:hypothetical protein
MLQQAWNIENCLKYNFIKLSGNWHVKSSAIYTPNAYEVICRAYHHRDIYCNQYSHSTGYKVVYFCVVVPGEIKDHISENKRETIT